MALDKFLGVVSSDRLLCPWRSDHSLYVMLVIVGECCYIAKTCWHSHFLYHSWVPWRQEPDFPMRQWASWEQSPWLFLDTFESPISSKTQASSRIWGFGPIPPSSQYGLGQVFPGLISTVISLPCVPALNSLLLVTLQNFMKSPSVPLGSSCHPVLFFYSVHSCLVYFLFSSD